MSQKKAKAAGVKPTESSASSSSTVVWGADVESEDFVKVPRTVLRLARYSSPVQLKPRHIVLLLVLAARKFKAKRIRAYWEELGEDLGVSKDTVRKWAYELQAMHLLEIRPHRGRDPEKNQVGHRNDRNEFNISAFIGLCEKAFHVRKRDRERREEKSS